MPITAKHVNDMLNKHLWSKSLRTISTEKNTKRANRHRKNIFQQKTSQLSSSCYHDDNDTKVFLQVVDGKLWPIEYKMRLYSTLPYDGGLEL